jgi:hypothetical protein
MTMSLEELIREAKLGGPPRLQPWNCSEEEIVHAAKYVLGSGCRWERADAMCRVVIATRGQVVTTAKLMRSLKLGCRCVQRAISELVRIGVFERSEWRWRTDGSRHVEYRMKPGSALVIAGARGKRLARRRR